MSTPSGKPPSPVDLRTYVLQHRAREITERHPSESDDHSPRSPYAPKERGRACAASSGIRSRTIRIPIGRLTRRSERAHHSPVNRILPPGSKQSRRGLRVRRTKSASILPRSRIPSTSMDPIFAPTTHPTARPRGAPAVRRARRPRPFVEHGARGHRGIPRRSGNGRPAAARSRCAPWEASRPAP